MSRDAAYRVAQERAPGGRHPVWVTEISYDSGPPDPAGIPLVKHARFPAGDALPAVAPGGLGDHLVSDPRPDAGTQRAATSRARAGRTTRPPAPSRVSRWPAGLRDSQQLPEAIFTPSTKADVGHDETIDFDRAAEIVGDRAVMEQLRDLSIELYSRAAEHAASRGVILADTKFEFGRDADGVLRVGDEVLTPDSSRFWPADTYEVGRPQPSFDKQYVRDWAAGTGWDKKPPAPAIPDDVVAGTRARYVEAYEKITGQPFDDWLARVAS